MKTVKLGDVAQTASGGTPARGNLSYYGGDIPWIKSGELPDGEIISVEESITQEGLENSSAKLVSKGTLVVAMYGATVGKLGILTFPAATNQAVCAITPSQKLDREFLFYWLLQIRPSLLEQSFGGAQPNISQTLIRNLDIPDIGIEDQHRIAARVKAQLAEVETARQAAEIQLADFQTLEYATLRDIFCDEDNGWPTAPLGDVGAVAAGVTMGRKPKSLALREVPYMRVANVKDGHLVLSEVKTIAATEAEIEKWTLRKGDILFTEGGDLDKVGRGALWSGEIKECIHQNHIYRVRFDPSQYLPEFIAFQVRSKYAKDYFFAHAKKTTGIASINQRVLKGFPILSPSVEEQKKVVARLTAQLGEVEKARQTAEAQLAEIKVLPQKILAAAFEADAEGAP